LIATTTDLQTYSVQKLYTSLKEDITQEGLTLVGSWSIGEYGDALLRGGQYEEEELVQEVKESDLVDLFESILNSSYAGLIVQQYIITAVIKLTTRLSDAAQIERLRRLLQRYGSNLDVETQQRAVEYSNLFGHDAVRRGVLEKMPPPEIREESRVLGEATKKRQSKVLNKKKPAQAATEDLLLDLMGDSGMPDTNGAASGSHQNQDLLADILGGGGPSTSSPPPQTTSPAPQSNVANIMDLFNSGPTTSPAPTQSRPPPQAASNDLLGGLGGMSSPPPQAPPSSGPPAHPVYNQNDLAITFQLKRDANAVQLLARFRNTGGFEQLSAVNLQAAVPKSQKLQLQPISASELSAGQDATQQMRVTSVNGVSLPNSAPPKQILTYKHSLPRHDSGYDLSLVILAARAWCRNRSTGRSRHSHTHCHYDAGRQQHRQWSDFDVLTERWSCFAADFSDDDVFTQPLDTAQRLSYSETNSDHHHQMIYYLDKVRSSAANTNQDTRFHHPSICQAPPHLGTCIAADLNMCVL
jgi:AP-1 complex subunit gamma-1